MLPVRLVEMELLAQILGARDVGGIAGFGQLHEMRRHKIARRNWMIVKTAIEMTSIVGTMISNRRPTNG